MLTSVQADILVAYLETMEARTDHLLNLRELKEKGISEDELDGAAWALGKIAGRDYRIK